MSTIVHPVHHLPAISGKILSGLAILVLIAGGVIAYRVRSEANSTATAFSTSAVTRGTVTSSVTGTGPISAASAVPLNFKTSGKLTAIKVNVGDQVKAGQVLATLDTADAQASMQQAQASLGSAQAAYDKVAQGALPTDLITASAAVGVAQTQLASAQHNLAGAQEAAAKDLAAAQQTVANAQQNLADVQQNASTVPAVVAQQIAQAKDRLYSDQVADDAAVGRGQMSKEARQAALDVDETAITQALASAQQTISQSQQSVNQAQQALNSAQAQLASTQAKDAQSIQSAKDQVAAAQSSLTQSQASYSKTAAPPTQSDLDSAKAQISNAQASVKLAQNNLDATTLTAPSDGTVTAINGAVGQWLAGGATSGSAVSSASGATTSTATQTLISLTSLNGLQITAAVNEADISKVQIGQAVKFSVDAFSGRTFTGKVAAIQPLGQTTSNVVTYSVIINTDKTDVQLLPGMTASANIITGEALNALQVPASALTYARTNASAETGTGTGRPGSAQGTTLYVPKAGQPVAVQVQLGLTDGKVYQVLSGLNEGDQVITAGTGGATSTGQQGGGPRGPLGFGF